ncbi:hypothetical protein WJX75_004586 [Coccomyxa subellipsoidea]|uniref:Uncharacterized protein n=1 Tax=Coccomyxa subellipsoidea TaxID=248742 RepID=A0ABR2YVX2_9CHLO
MSETLKVFQERGVLAQREYGEEVPASVHGAPRTVEVLAVAWVIATVFFLVTYTSPCAKVPPPEQLKFFELGGSDQDFFSGVDDTDARGLKHFPRLWKNFLSSAKFAGKIMLPSAARLYADEQIMCVRILPSCPHS